MRTTVLAGGVGSARFCAGLVRVVDPSELTIVVNTGDDECVRGLHVCPDVDSVLYHLASATDWDRGWGMADETFVADERYKQLVERADLGGGDLQEWFALGDRDLATNLLRTRLLETGRSLSEATDALRRGLRIGCRVLPMSDDPVRTKLRTNDGALLDFQDYFVRLRAEPAVTEVVVDGAADARPAPGVLAAIERANVVVLPPSNPLISLGPLLATGGIAGALAASGATRVAISPIVGGRALKGPADRMLADLGHDVSPAGVARFYAGSIDLFVCDDADRGSLAEIEALGVRAVATDTIMGSPEDAARVAKAVLDAC